MVKGTCEKKDCTFTETEICLEGHEDASNCPHFRLIDESVSLDPDDSLLEKDISTETQKPSFIRRFHSGNELGLEEATKIMRNSYVHLIGILGKYDVGKTCLLSSLYLMTSCGGLLPDYLFAGSQSLQGFEIRARRLRKWKHGTLPDKLADHTYLQDPNTPAFMHLSLKEQSSQYRHLNLLLTDLPGEWSTDLIDRADTASRFDFLKRADGIIYVIDGPRLASTSNRNTEIFDAKLMLKRLLHNVQIDKSIPLVLLISKCDELDMKEPKGVVQIREQAVEMGFTPIVILAASFSKEPENIPSGTGILEAIKVIIDHNWQLPDKSDSKIMVRNSRAFGRFRLE